MPSSLLRAVPTALRSPAALFELRGRTWAWVFLYLFLSTLLLGVTAALVWHYRGDIRAALLAFFFPPSWHRAVELLADHFFAQQLHVLLANTIAGAAMFVVTLLLFPLKEQVSTSYEREARLVDDPIDELSLPMQAWQEAKVFLLFLGAQETAFWIGYRPEPHWQLTAKILSSLILVVMCAVDFVSPLLQRHRGHYSQILKTLAFHPLASLLFGVIFSAPALAVGLLWKTYPDWSLATAVPLLFGAALVSVVWAQVAGTRVAAAMYPRFRTVGRARGPARIFAWLAAALMLGGNAVLFTAVGGALLTKTPVLRCEYEIEWSSFSADRPSLRDLAARRVELGAHVDLRIHNPTQRDVEIEHNVLEIRHRGALVATPSLDPVRVPAGGTETRTVGFRVALDPTLVMRGRDLLRGRDWSIVLYLRVDPPLLPAFDFPVYLKPPRDLAYIK